MAFDAMMSDATEQRALSKHYRRANRTRMMSTSRQHTRDRFPNVPEGSAIFTALHNTHVKDPKRLEELPISARRKFGDSTLLDTPEHEDAESLYEAEPETVLTQRSASRKASTGVLGIRGRAEQPVLNGVGHARLPTTMLNDRLGRAGDHLLGSQGRKPMTMDVQVYAI